jgi:hypothetical protein
MLTLVHAGSEPDQLLASDACSTLCSRRMAFLFARVGNRLNNGSPFKGTDIARLLAAFGLFGDITFEIAVRAAPAVVAILLTAPRDLLSSTCIEVNTLDVHSECSKSLPLLVYLASFQLLSTGSLGLCWFESFGGTTSSLSCLRRIRCCCLFGHFPRQRCMKLLTNSLNLDTFILHLTSI